ncbi:MAG: endolytic transglycosylase MltG [Erysipelotrichaceae bacterium]|nr:endolytic transglycosylase MltG [Erysipelotrichaceae bacterium]
MKKRTKIIIAILIILFLIIGIIAGIAIYIKSSLKPTKQFLNGEICENNETPCEVTPFIVDEGAYGKSTLEKLQEYGIIKDSDIVYYYNRLFTGYSFAAGYFELPHKVADEYGNMREVNLDDILAFLADPKNAHQDTVTLSFDEGDFVRAYAKKIGENTTVKEAEIFAYWNNKDVIRSYMSEYPFLTEDIFNANPNSDEKKCLLEGYLFPDTYEFFEFTNCDEITRKFLDRTLDIYNSHQSEFAESEFSIHEVFTLASIVQWESGNAEDSKIIAGVFVTRMNEPEILGSTVTACYAFDLSKDECYSVGDTLDYTWRDDPYNTYTNQGLPPGPVCCPNETAIVAALHPDSSQGYFFFCADMCNGGTVFARTEAEHQYNVEHYYLACDY